ncbi:hypothetical protein VQ056_12385 [Paenibacillus sp. JTLBN-2024]
MMELKVWGGAGGAWPFLLRNHRKPASDHARLRRQKGGTGQYPLLEENLIPGLTAVFLSHAHEDHSMALPLLYKHGYRGEI